MRLEAGKRYMTREGNEVFVFAIERNPFYVDSVTKAYGFSQKHKTVTEWYLDGRTHKKQDGARDIVRPVIDKELVSYMGRNDKGEFHIIQDKEELQRLGYANIQEVVEYWQNGKLLYIEKA